MTQHESADWPGWPFTSPAEYQQARRLAAERQQIAHEATFLSPWDELTPDEQAPGVVSALYYLRAVRRADLDGQADVDGPSEEAIKQVRQVCDSYTGLYGASMIREAARLLDDLAETAARHGLSRDDARGNMARYAVESVSRKYGRPKAERTVAEMHELMGVLSDAFHEIGLTTTDAAAGAGVAVEPVAGGPSWGWDGKTGLVVVLYLDDGWTLMVNRAGMRRPVPIYAPATGEGARDVADLVGQVLRREVKDPFRDGPVSPRTGPQAVGPPPGRHVPEARSGTADALAWRFRLDS